MYLLKVQKKLCYASAIYWRVLAIYSISWALKNVILSLRTVTYYMPQIGFEAVVIDDTFYVKGLEGTARGLTQLCDLW